MILRKSLPIFWLSGTLINIYELNDLLTFGYEIERVDEIRNSSSSTLLYIEPNDTIMDVAAYSHYTVYELIEILNKLIKDGQRGARK